MDIFIELISSCKEIGILVLSVILTQTITKFLKDIKNGNYELKISFKKSNGK